MKNVPICQYCQKPATRWNGGQEAYFCTEKGMVKAPKYQFCCVDCDPRHKWFDIGDDPEERAEIDAWLEESK